MRAILGRDPDFANVKCIIEEFYDGQEGFEWLLNAKFWCNLAWVENYWNDAKRDTRTLCDYTIPTLKKNFPIALRTSVPPSRMRNYQRKCMEHMKVLQEIGRRGDFSVYPTLVKKYKSHRNSELIRLGHISEAQVRKRSDWGKIEHARRVFGPTLAVMEMPDDV